MIKLLIGVKGTGKTKTLVDLADAAVKSTNGAVVFIEKGNTLTFNVNYQCRLIDSDEYGIKNAEALYGLIAGILASNHDVTDLFIDSSLKICNNDIPAAEALFANLDKLTEKLNVNCVVAASIPVEEASDFVKAHV